MSLRTGEFFIYSERMCGQMDKRRTTVRKMTGRQRRRRRMLAAAMLSVILISFTAFFVLGQGKGETVSRTEQKDVENLNGLNSRNAVLMDLEAGEILADKGADEKVYPASLTKIMTAVWLLRTFRICRKV